jgi:ADP-heptose:LPS heptosyltransferase
MTRFIVSVERVWRNVIVYPLFRLILRNRQAVLPLDLSNIHSILILRYDKIGDMIVTLPIFQMLKKRNPNVRIGVVASEVNIDIVRGERTVDAIFILHRNPFMLVKELLRIRRQQYQVVLNFIFNRMTSGALIANFACPDALKIGQGQEKYRFYFNALLSLPRGSNHMFELLISFVEQVFGMKVGDEEKVIQLSVDINASGNVDIFLERHSLRRRSVKMREEWAYVVFNVSARQVNKRLTAKQATAIAAYLGNQLNMNTVVIAAPEDENFGKHIISEARSIRCWYFPEGEKVGLKEITSLVEGAKCVITPDTAIVHIASAVLTPVLGIFTPLQVNQEWLPYKVAYKLIRASEGQPVSAIPVEILLDGVRNYFKHHSSLQFKGPML